MIELDDVLYEAVTQGREVRLTAWDGHGFAIEVDGMRVAEGLPTQHLYCPIDSLDLDVEQRAFIERLEASREARNRRRRRERERERTEGHRAAEGADLPSVSGGRA